MYIEHQKKRIKALELINKVNVYENANRLRLLRDEKNYLSQLQDQERYLVDSIKDIDDELCRTVQNPESEFVHQQKINFLERADRQIKKLSSAIDISKSDICQIESEIESSINKKIVLEDNLHEYKRVMSRMLDVKFQLDMS